MKKKLIIFSLFAIGITTPVFSHNSLNTKTNCATNTSNLLAGSAGCAGPCECGKTCTDAFGTKYICCSGGGHRSQMANKRFLREKSLFCRRLILKLIPS